MPLHSNLEKGYNSKFTNEKPKATLRFIKISNGQQWIAWIWGSQGYIEKGSLTQQNSVGIVPQNLDR